MKFRSFETQTRRRTEQIWPSKYENCPAFDSRCLDGGPLRRSPPHVDVAGAGGKKKRGERRRRTSPPPHPQSSHAAENRSPLSPSFVAISTAAPLHCYARLPAVHPTSWRETTNTGNWKIRRYIFDELLLRRCTQNTFPYLRNGRND